MITLLERRGDLLLAGVCLTVPTTDLFLHDHVHGLSPLSVAGIVLCFAGMAGSLLLRSARPLSVTVVCGAGGFATWALGFTSPLGGLSAGIALYSVGVAGVPLTSAVAVALVIPVSMVLEARTEGVPPLSVSSLGHAALVICPVLVGHLVRQRRDTLLLRLRRAEDDARAELNLRQLRVEQERRRIARDLHDVVGHALTTISVQASTAERLLDKRPEFARQALAEIATAGREALTELRGIVSVLREPDGGTSRGGEPPGPGLAALPGLVDQARAVGVRATLVRTGAAADRVPASVQLATYRIVQESLTNIRRHAGEVSAVIEVEVGDDAVTAWIRNAPGPRPATPAARSTIASGAGITGMRERTGLTGGTLLARPTEAGGFEIEAVLPYRPGGGSA